MPKKKHSPEWMIARAREYLTGQGSYESIAKENGVGLTTIIRWVAKYRETGESAFYRAVGHKTYSKEFKLKCVEAVLSGEGSVEYITAKYGISHDSVLRDWIKKYNANIEFKDYGLKSEVYMANARRKTTCEERKEIVEYCLSHNKDYKGSAEKYDVSYSQVYAWVRKYTEKGESGLTDLRGHHKADEELDETESLRRQVFVFSANLKKKR